MRFTACALVFTVVSLVASASWADDTDDLFEDAVEAAKTSSEPEAPAGPRKIHSHAEIKATLIKQNKVLAEQLAKFIDLSKQLARQSLDNEDMMEVFRQYGPAVIRMKQRWQAVVGTPAKYDTWLGSSDYAKSWQAFIASWDELYNFTDSFAAVDIDVADKVTDGLTTLGASFEEYCDIADEWDGKLGNSAHAFARTAEIGGVEEVNMGETTTEDAEAPRDPSEPEEAQPLLGEADEIKATEDEAAKDEALEEEAKGDEATLEPETPDAEAESTPDAEESTPPAEEPSSDDELDFGEDK
jgi:hypothetical protein